VNRNVIIATAIVCVVALLVGGWLFLRSRRPPPIQFGCVKETQRVEVTDGRFMTGVVEEGKSYEALIGFYQCNLPQRGDVVLYRFSPLSDPVIKIVRAVEGDRFELVADKARGAWNLKINGHIHTYNEEPYFFGGRGKPTLGLYEKDRNNTLGPNEVILFSLVPPGINDSGMFGLVHKNDLIAKIRLP